MKGIKVGPGEYDIKSELELKKSGYTISKEARDHLEKRNVPGPGTYDYENAVFKYGSKQDPSYGFGSKLGEQTALNVPGPGAYENKSQIYSKIEKCEIRMLIQELQDLVTMSQTVHELN